MRILVCGGRAYDDRREVFLVLDAIAAGAGRVTIIHGACGEDADKPKAKPVYTGADGLAHAWAVTRGFFVEPCPAHWTKHGRSGGPKRNKRMLKDYKPSLVIAFPGDRGTANMVKLAQAAGVNVVDLRVIR